MDEKPSDVLRDVGRFAPLVKGYSPRVPQLEMADRLADLLDHSGTLVCEAGTGIGKTLAYLIPVLLHGARAIVSTASKTLQEQLFHVDLPVARSVTASTARVALLKGRGNYLCLYRFAAARHDLALTPADLAHIEHIGHWLIRTTSGDISELTDIPEDAGVWPRVTSTIDNCLGNQCPDFENCFVVRARRRAAGAALVVVNHHLLLAEFVLREDGFAELLPDAEVVVCDEAHQLPEIATQFFGFAVSSRQLFELCRDCLEADSLEAGDVPALPRSVERLDRAVQAFRRATSVLTERRNWDTVRREANIAAAWQAVTGALQTLSAHLQDVAERGPSLQHCADRALHVEERVAALEECTTEQNVRWIEASRGGVVVRASPIAIGGPFNAGRRRLAPTWMFTSATLAVGEDVSYFCRRMGMEGEPHDFQILHSPFNYQEQALCYLPALPHEPAHPDYADQVLTLAARLIQAARGRTFMLFTSHRALGHAAAELGRHLPEGYALLVQGDQPKQELLKRFRTTPHAVLLGTASFWEGVDVRGDALVNVIIDKLPFAAPGDPVLQARLRAIEQQGLNAFQDYQLPEAALTLKQGAGRLIRDHADRGVLTLCDPRITTRAYGRVFLEALPPMQRTRDVDEVTRFLLQI